MSYPRLQHISLNLSSLTPELKFGLFYGSTGLVGLDLLIVEVFEISVRHTAVGGTPLDQ